jgi:predicted nucleotidyltransferase
MDVSTITRNDFRDRDFIETNDSLFFTVVGYVHPNEKILAYLKYYPGSDGKWTRSGTSYERAIKFYDIPHLKETLKILQRNWPKYLHKDELLNISFSAVPKELILIHHKPEKKLDELINSSDLDLLQRKTIDIATILSEESGVNFQNFGISGSILIGLHQISFSDIDLIIYGKKNGWKVREALLSLIRLGGSKIEAFPKDEVPTPSRQKRLSLMNDMQLRLFYDRKWNRGVIDGTPFSVNPVFASNDIQEIYGKYRCESLGIVEGEATVTDASESIFVPAKYLIADVKIDKNGQFNDVKEVISYDRDYGDIAFDGEKILIRGKLESVENLHDGTICHRIVIGSFEGEGTDYIKIAT